MTRAEHIQHHVELHRSLDRLVADWIRNNRGGSIRKASIIELMEWSFQQTENPSLPDGQSHTDGDSAEEVVRG